MIDLLLRVLLEPGDCVINCPPTFGMYPFDTLLNAGQVIEIPRLAGPRMRAVFRWIWRPSRLRSKPGNPRSIFITTPNNPDGSLPPPDEIRRLLALPLLVVIDEAYIEFTRSGGRLGEQLSRLREAPRRENLVVLRTFSKWAGLAGLRVGYGAFPDWMLPALWKAKQPYNVNVAASAAALASLQDLDYLADNVERIRQERERLFGALQDIPFLRPYPSQANFILCQVIGQPAKALQDELASQGILVRYYNNALLKDFIRVSVGRPQDSAALLAALQELDSNQKLASRASIPLTSAAAKPVGSAETAGSEENDKPLLRQAAINRKTGETQVEVRLDIDGTGRHQIDTGLPFLDHMLTQVAVHGLFDLYIQAKGDLQIDPHHTLEDVALTLGSAFQQALGDRAGIVRMASADCPMDESLAWAAVDFSGRPYASSRPNGTAPWWRPARLAFRSLLGEFCPQCALQPARRRALRAR